MISARSYGSDRSEHARGMDRHDSRSVRANAGCSAENARGGVLADTAPTARGGTSSVLDFANVRRVQPLRAACNVELERLSLGERLEPFASDGREVNEHVLAAIRLGDE